MPGRSANRMSEQLYHQLGITSGEDDRLAAQEAAGLLKDYLRGYTGRGFDSYGSNDPFTITSDDLIAVTMLSIKINESSTSSIRPSAILALQAAAVGVSSQLEQLPADRELHMLGQAEFDLWLGPGAPGSALYELLRHQIALPRVATHKLLARKRPLLLPIRDRVVEQALDAANPDEWWRPWWQTLRTEGAVVAQLQLIREVAEAPHLSLLRVADIVIWMKNR